MRRLYRFKLCLAGTNPAFKSTMGTFWKRIVIKAAWFSASIFVLPLPAVGATDSSVMVQLNSLLKTEEEMHVKLDNELVDAMKEIQAVSVLGAEHTVEAILSRHQSKVADIKNNLVENHLRIEFFNALINTLDHHPPTDIRKDSPTIFLDLAHKEILASVESGNESPLWLFEVYLSTAIKDIMEPSENYADFIKRYLVFSSIRDPRPPQDYLKSRKYIGGQPSGG